MVFNEYAHYYDLLYKDKDYVGEAEYIDSLIKKYNSNTKKILDLGCGTGKHADILSKRGYKVHGIDLSESMLYEAQKKTAGNKMLSFSISNIQDFSIEEKYDTIIALFHVMSYQITDEEINKVFDNVYKHLNEGGIFIFDCWYGPAVLWSKPEFRVKRLENENIKVTRIAEPVMLENENIVKVNYDVFVENKKNKHIKEIKETHNMRYLFKNEIMEKTNNNGFVYIDDFEFMTNKSLNKETWGSCFVVRK